MRVAPCHRGPRLARSNLTPAVVGPSCHAPTRLTTCGCLTIAKLGRQIHKVQSSLTRTWASSWVSVACGPPSGRGITRSKLPTHAVSPPCCCVPSTYPQNVDRPVLDQRAVAVEPPAAAPRLMTGHL